MENHSRSMHIYNIRGCSDAHHVNAQRKLGGARDRNDTGCGRDCWSIEPCVCVGRMDVEYRYNRKSFLMNCRHVLGGPKILESNNQSVSVQIRVSARGSTSSMKDT